MDRWLLAYKFCTSNNQLPECFRTSFSFTIIKVFVLFVAFSATLNVTAQQTAPQQQSSYIKVITERSAKIVNTLSIKDSVQYKKVLAVLVQQYNSINNIHEESKIALAAIKQQSITPQESALQLQQLEEKKAALLLQLHEGFLTQLKINLSEEQVELVKDGMTYRIFPITYSAYQDMVLTLTQEQKAKIYDWLKEARELAMDAESSDKKHAIFGKYKGRINNYLSAAGYNMKKEGEEWQKRIDAKKSAQH